MSPPPPPPPALRFRVTHPKNGFGDTLSCFRIHTTRTKASYPHATRTHPWCWHASMKKTTSTCTMHDMHPVQMHHMRKYEVYYADATRAHAHQCTYTRVTLIACMLERTLGGDARKYSHISSTQVRMLCTYIREVPANEGMSYVHAA